MNELSTVTANETPTITVAEPISRLWNVIDNRAVSWCNRQVDWMCWYATTATRYTGYMTDLQYVLLNVAQKAVSTTLHTLGNYANVHRVQSTFHANDIKNLAMKEDPTSTEKYQLADLLYKRSLQYDFGAEILLASPGHHKEESNFLIRLSRFYLKSELCSYLLLRAKYGEELWVRPPEIAIIHDVEAAKALYKEVMGSTDPLLTEATKANAIYKYAFLYVLGSFKNKNGEPVSDDLPTVVQECKKKFDDLTNKGTYAKQMDRLCKVENVNLKALADLSRHHPHRALEIMDDFGIHTHRFRDICKECSKNMGIRDKVTRF